MPTLQPLDSNKDRHRIVVYKEPQSEEVRFGYLAPNGDPWFLCDDGTDEILGEMLLDLRQRAGVLLEILRKVQEVDDDTNCLFDLMEAVSQAGFSVGRDMTVEVSVS